MLLKFLVMFLMGGDKIFGLRRYVRQVLREAMSIKGGDLRGAMETSDLMQDERTYHPYLWAAKAFVGADHADGTPIEKDLPEMENTRRKWPRVKGDYYIDVEVDDAPWNEYDVPDGWGW